LLVPIIAIFGLILAFQQGRINKKRLKHELFDRRYEQFRIVSCFIGSILSSGKLEGKERTKYLIGISGVRFIFDEKIANYLKNKILEPANDLECLALELDGVPVGSERAANIQKQSEIKKKFSEELKGLEEKSSEYLQLKH